MSEYRLNIRYFDYDNFTKYNCDIYMYILKQYYYDLPNFVHFWI